MTPTRASCSSRTMLTKVRAPRVLLVVTFSCAAYEGIEQMKNEYYETEQQTIQINKRETLLGVEKTLFTALKMVQDELRPMHDLWSIANQFNETFGVWMEEKFELLESEQIERSVNDWQRALQKLSKTVLNQNKKPMEMLRFILKVIEKFRVSLAPVNACRCSCR